MDTELISKSLCFHGQPLQKIWEGERGSHDLSRLGLSNPDYSIYTQRQKNLTFQDRAKRLRLHQFLARKAEDLYDANLVDRTKHSSKPKKDGLLNTTTVVMPPFEIFANKHLDKSKYVHHNFDAIKPGDVVFGSVTSRSASGLLVKVICTGEPLIRYLFDIKAFVLAQNLIQAIDKKGISRPFAPNDHVCCEVLDISADADRMTLGMKGVAAKNPKIPLGLISADQYPEYYKRMVDDPHNSYEDYLISAKQFENPNYAEQLYDAVGLDVSHAYSNMKTLKYRFPQAEYSDELRQLQASKWAFRSVADGIEHFKIGRHTEAFQCLNKALNIDACNVEGLVARGALYANSGSFQKAVHDFETALKLNPYHANARRYMGETLVALGRSFEEDQRYEDARKAYKSCLDIIPSHEEAQSSLDTLNSNIPPQLDTNNFMFSGPIAANSIENELFAPASRPDIKNNKYNEFKESSSSSESDSGSSNESSSNSNHSKYSDKNKNRRSFKPSLSPLSKRMVEMEPSGGPSNYQFNQPFHLSVGTSSSQMVNDYENKFQHILDYNRDDDYDDKVRKLLEETNHRKDYDDNSKSKEKRKHKNDSKENKKEKNRDGANAHHPSRNEMNHFEIADNGKMVEPHSFSNNIESKLKDNLHKYEENIEKLKKLRPETTFINQHMLDVHKISTPSTTYNRQPSPSFPPYMHLNSNEIPTPVPSMHMIMPNSSPYVSNMKADGTFKPFPIKAPIVLDKFGCFRLATAPENDIKKLDRSSYRSRSRSRSRGRRVRSRSRSRNRRSRSRRRFRSRSRSRYHSRSPVRRTRLARSRSRRKSRSNSLPARRTPSPFVPRHTPPPQRYRRSRSPFRCSYRGSYRGSFRSFHPRGRGRGRGRSFYTFVKKRSPRNRSRSRSRSRSHTRSRTRSRSLSFEDKNRRSNFNSSNKSGLHSRWEHDKYVKDDPTIEEIDEIINKAQKERKKEIIQRDRSIVKNK